MSFEKYPYYFSEDGTYGDANELVMISTLNWTQQEWDEIAGCGDFERQKLAVEIAARHGDEPIN